MPLTKNDAGPLAHYRYDLSELDLDIIPHPKLKRLMMRLRRQAVVTALAAVLKKKTSGNICSFYMDAGDVLIPLDGTWSIV